MLLDHIGAEAAAVAVEEAVAADLATRGNAVRSTSQVGDALAVHVEFTPVPEALENLRASANAHVCLQPLRASLRRRRR